MNRQRVELARGRAVVQAADRGDGNLEWVALGHTGAGAGDGANNLVDVDRFERAVAFADRHDRVRRRARAESAVRGVPSRAQGLHQVCSRHVAGLQDVVRALRPAPRGGWVAAGWPGRVDDSGVALTADFSAPSAGPPPWFVYRLAPRRGDALEILNRLP